MSWSTRLGGWVSGRYSPFSSYHGEPPHQVTQDDYSYISPEDLPAHDGQRHPSHDGLHSTSHPARAHQPPADPDILLIRHQRVTYPLQFPTYSIDDGDLTVGDLRASAARELPGAAGDKRRIRLIYNGRTLKEDVRACRDENLRSGSELLGSISEVPRTEADVGDESDDSEDVEDDTAIAAGTAGGAGEKKKRRKRKSKRKKGGQRSTDNSGTASPMPSDSIRAEHLPVPASLHPSNRQNGTAASGTGSAAHSRQPSPAPPPQTASQKLDAVAATLQRHARACDEFAANPPGDKAKREFEHKKLEETMLQQVVFKLDAVDTDDGDLRMRRKGLVREAQDLLRMLDEAKAGHSRR